MGEKKSGKLIESGFMRQLRLHACSSFYFTFFRVKIEVVLFSVGKHREDALAFFSFNLFFFLRDALRKRYSVFPPVHCSKRGGEKHRLI